MSLKYVVPGNLSAANAPILGFDDGQIVDGSLLYLEPARQGFTRSPEVGDVVTNWARGSLSALTSAPVSNCDAEISNVGAGVDGAMEVTSSGALHGFFNTGVAAATSETERWDMLWPQSLIDHIYANPTHVYYMDAVFRSTQDPLIAGSPSGGQYILMGISEERNSFSGADVMFGARHLADSDNTDSVNCNLWPAPSWSGVLSSDRNTWTPSPALSHARVVRSDINGNFSSGAEGYVSWRGPRSGTDIAGGQSFIFYSAYVEDCTVSGRSYADVKAWREAQVAEDFASGGRYYGETWTDPASVVW